MANLKIDYQVESVTPLHVGTGMGLARIVDDRIVRAGPARGEGVPFPYMPGSTLKGRLRWRCEAIANSLGLLLHHGRPRWCKQHLCIICRLFGSPFNAGGLHFSDALLVSLWKNMARPADDQQRTSESPPFLLSTVRTGNKVERATRTVEPDFLFSLEHSAEGITFQGSITGSVSTLVQPGASPMLPAEVWLLVVGLLSLDKLGGARSRGLGRCKVTVTRLSLDESDLTGQLTNLLAQDDSILGVDDYDS